MQNYGIFQMKHRGSLGKQVCTCQFTIPEVKIVFVIFYWLVQSVLFWTLSSIRAGRVDITDNHLTSYANCMAGGSRKDHDCDKLRMNLEAEANPALETIALMLIAFLNLATLSFVVQFKAIRNSVSQAVNIFTTK